MKETKLVLPERTLNESLLPLQRGRVFHVTLADTLTAIRADGEIRPNTTGQYSSPVGRYNSFFRNRGCVSLFDYRSVTEEELAGSLPQCSAATWMHASRGSELAILLLARERCPELQPWSLWKDENALSEMIVPHVEAGHRGPVPLDLVDEVLCVEVELDETSFGAKLRAALEKTAGN